MPDRAGTLERVAIELAAALVRVPSGLRDELLPETLAELGISFPGPIPAGVVSAADAAATAADAVPSVLQALIDAVQAGDDFGIAGKALALLGRSGQIVQGFVTLGDALAAAGVAVPGDFGQRTLDLFILAQIDLMPAASNILALLGIIELTEHPGFTERRLRWHRIVDLLTDPTGHFGRLYDWGTGEFTGDKLLEAIHGFIARMGLPTILHPAAGGQPMRLEAFAFDLTPSTTRTGALDVDVMFPVGGNLDVVISLPHPAWTARMQFGGQIEVGIKGTIAPPLEIDLHSPAAALDGQVMLTLRGAPAAPFVLFGQAGKSRLEVGGVEVGLGAKFVWDSGTGHARAEPLLGGQITRGKVIIDQSGGDGFVSTLLSGVKVEAGFDLGFAWSLSKGIQFDGSGGLAIRLPIHIALGPVQLTGIYLSAELRSGAVPIEVSVAMNATLGPLQASVDRLGVLADLSFPPNGGNAGPAQFDIGFKPPNGVGLAVNAGVVKGGGYLYFDPDHGEYAGALELEFAEFLALKAIGLITTRMPDGSSGFSLLIIITAEFPGGLQLGYGFTLLGVGGLLGLNRTMRLDALAEGVRTGAIESVMFPRDVVANAPRILSDLKAFFPPQQGTFLIGPMAKIGWGTPTLISIAVGIIIEIPGNIAIVGVIKVALPTEDAPILLLQVNFIGAIEFDKKRIWFFASLFESRVLMLTIDGELGLLVAYGDEPNFVLTVGGFHPAFVAPTLPFPTPKRVAINILNTDNARIAVTGYFAVTSNTAQFGASAELYFGFSAFSVRGHIGFDALFRFSPFSFIIEVHASVSLKAFGVGLFSISLRFSLEGPTPWRARGTGSISLLFFEISADFDLTWGEERDTTLPSLPVLPLLATEFAKPECWRTLAPSGGKPLVILRVLPEAERDLVLHPLGTLFVVQRAVPLDIRLDKVGSQAVSDVSRCTVEVASEGLKKRSDPEERFALAQFQNMDDAAKLSRPAFERQHAGAELGSDGTALASQRVTRRSTRYEEIIIDPIIRQAPKSRRLTTYNTTLFKHFLRGSSVSRSPLSSAEAALRQPYAETIKVTGDTYAIASTRDNTTAGPTFTSYAQARDYLDDQLAADPSLADNLHIIPLMEVAA